MFDGQKPWSAKLKDLEEVGEEGKENKNQRHQKLKKSYFEMGNNVGFTHGQTAEKESTPIQMFGFRN